MKKLTLFIFAFAISTMTFSQEILMGPKFKNAPVGKVQGPRITLLHESSPASLQGPVAKNTEVWMARSAKKVTVGFRDTIDNPKGIQAKNNNPWDKKTSKVDSKAVYEEPKSMRPKKGWFH
ncbi:hypothetical protein [Algoriphagus boritolerans]|uniref:Uncharacterized protein n=1 Tax=Algoriphagus boritolerans DSM 17298 = JCM 18970 TaxID=1120964 RepID=A0A1H5VW20_9BACT|nr:hypothetical protein [Algoriphagus boritolerans]SEF91188.1 hypothetical protein SAMN03080598_01825 [Algoriphagus boritolerans DSM 17298 = JCM 18970]